MDGQAQFEREAATDELDDTLHLQAFYARSDSSGQTNTVLIRRSPRSGSGPRLGETRAMATAP